MEEGFTFTENKRGQETLLQGKYRYNLSVTNANGTSRWRCVKRDECSTTLALNKERTMVLRPPNHTCSSRKIENIILLTLNACKEEVCHNFEPVQRIYEKHFEKLKEECSSDELKYVPSFSSVKDSMFAKRKNFLNSSLLNFKKIEEVVVPEGLGKHFFNCADGEQEKIIIFCSKTSRNLLKKTIDGITFFGDGTFRCVPCQFYQLYTLHVDLFSNENTTNVIPAVFALLPNKSEQTYVRFFSLVKDKLGIIMNNFKCDFEIATINAVQTVYPNCQVTTCFYHYNKNIWKKAKTLKLTGSKEGRNFTRKVALLPLLPYNRISETWFSISNSVPDTNELKLFKKYFEEQWMKLNPKILSCSTERHRTTNPVEGWHRRINARIPRKPTFFAFVAYLRKEAKYYDFKIKRSLFLTMKKNRRNIDIKFDKDLKLLLQKLEQNEMTSIEFLKKVIYRKLRY